MNKAYKSIYNERTGTFVAVSENSKARGKRSSSRVRAAGGLAAAVAAGAFFMGAAWADVDIPNAGEDNVINFNTPGGSIDFTGGGSINGLTSITASSGLTLNGVLTANGVVVNTNATLASGNMQVVTGGQLYQTNQNVTNAQAAITALQGQVGNLGTSVTTNDLNVASGALTASSTSVAIGTNLNMGGNKITNLANGDINASSTDAVNGRQVYDLFFESGTAGGVRYFRANSAEPDSQALGDQSIAIGPNTVARGDSSFVAGDGASATETAEGSIALGQNAAVGSTIDGVGAIAIGRDSVADRNGSVALGDGAQGSEADATAVGAGAQAGAANATALGAGALASGGSSISIGDSEASAGNAFAAGTGAYAATANSIALGVNAGVGTVSNAGGDRTDHIAIGTSAGQNVAGNQTTAIGYGAGSNVTGDDNVALGTEAGRSLQGNNNISIGLRANDGAGNRAQAIAIGGGTQAGSDSVALGDGAQARGSETLALGKDASAEGNGVAVGAYAHADGNSIALGRNSAARVADAAGSGYLTGSAAPDSVVSVGNADPSTGVTFQRRIVNVADGSHDYDAVNVRQLRGAQTSVATLVGGSVTVNADGSFSPITVLDTNGDPQQFNTIVDAIGAVTSGAVDILPVDAVRYNSSHGISNVAAGVNATDAVNVEQLNQAIADNGVKYYSANTNIAANRTNNGATGQDAMAIGPAAVAGGDSSLAVGHAARVNDGAHNGIAIGRDVSARATNSTVLGNSGAAAYDQGGVAIGQQAVSRGMNSIVMGTGAEADPKSGGTVDNAIVIGTVAEATADDGIAIGQSALASEERAVAQGYDAHATAEDAQAFGTRARASAISSQASGTDARASGVNSIATGTDSRAYAADGIAIGTGAVTGHANPPLGEERRNLNGIAVGNTALADSENAMALGVAARALAESATAVGDGAEASALNALAVGTDARVTGVNASAFGRGAEATALNASAIGQGAQAAHEHSVALGSGALTAVAVGTSSMMVDKNTYNFAGTNPIATVSVGAPGAERTITNVAAGRVSATSTDAINGSQLYGTNVALDRLADNLDTAGQSVANALGGGSSYNPTTHQVTANLTVNGNTYNNVQDALGYVGQGWNVSADGGASENVAPGGSVDFGNTDDNIVVTRNGTNMTFNLANDIEVGNSITVGDTVIDGDSITTNNLTVEGETHLGDNFVVNNDGDVTYNGSEIATQADGLSFRGNTGGTIAKALGDDTPLTVSGLLAAGDASTGANLRVDSDGNQLNLVMARNLTDLDSITINNGGPVINSGGINMRGNKITNLAVGTADTDAVNVSQLNDVADIANAGWNVGVPGQGSANVAPGGTVEFSNEDENIVITRDGTDLAFNLADDVEIGNSLTVGDTIVNNGGVTTNNLTVEGETRLGDNFFVNNDGDVTYNGSEIATQADGLSFRGNTGGTIAKALGDDTPLIISGGLASTEAVTGENLRVDSEGGQLNLVMARNLTDLDSITINNGGPVIHAGGINMNNNRITNLAPGVDGTDAVNVDQLNDVADIANAGWNVSVGGEGALADNKVGPNSVVDFSNTDGNIEITRNGTDLEFNLSKDIDLGSDGSLTTGNTRVDNDGLAVDDGAGNATKTTVAGTTVTNDAGDTTTMTAAGTTVTNAAGDTTTVEAGNISVAAGGNETTIGSTQVMVGGGNPITIDGGTGTISGLQNQTIEYPEFADGSGRAASEEQLKQVNDTANAGWNLAASEGDTVNIGPDGLVTFEGDDNIAVAQTGDDQNGVVEITLNKDIDLGPDGSVTTGNTVMDNTGLTVNDTTAGTLTSIGSGAIALADSDGNVTTIDPTNVTVGGAFPISINGNTGVIAGLQNQSIFYGGFADGSGRAATEEQLGSITNFLGLEEGAGGSPVFNYNGQDHASLADALDSMHWNVEAPAPDNSGGAGGGSGGGSGDGSNNAGGNGGGGNSTPIHNGNTVGFVEGDNIVISKTERPDGAGADIKVSVAQDISVNSITAVQVNAGQIQADEIQISNGGPVINENGIDMSGKPITNVAAGVNETDAVNVGQLQQAAGNLQGQVNSLRNDVRRLDNKLSAGVAAAMATAALPQAYLPGKNMMAMAGGTWNGESGMAIGFSGITDNGKWIYKLSGNATSRGDYGGAVGIGYQW
ncbi:YadA-like family protein [Pusillimonas sp.]|uniref:YadA-like family protein n=1 Tax=Pusillimonas sp. TaxID=3040095 RepID=UPI0029BDCE4C|nr:YadA-like family protein [Pusillimonas sp.]MDX3893442.1 YadA-like family protein [Pusillimonas sp.]